MSREPGPDDPCPCGSGKKLKFCHGTVAKHRKEVIKKIPRLLEMQSELQKPLRLTSWPQMEVEAFGKKLCAVGGKLYESPKNEPFHRFLINVLFEVLGTEWYQEQLSIPAQSLTLCHMIFQWWVELNEQVERVRPDPNFEGPVSVPVTGNTQELLVLADDVYQLEHALITSPPLIDRLRKPTEFQGARYEILAASIMARCAFKIEFIQDTATKRPEFVATAKVGGKQIAVEAKSRHREGVLHQPGQQRDSISRADIARLFKKALDKVTDGLPFVIFIDLNLPATPNVRTEEKHWLHETQTLLENWKQRKPEQLQRVSGVVLTNFGWHYHREQNLPPNEFIMIPFESCNHPLEEKTWLTLRRALDEYGFIPDEEEHRREIKTRYPEFAPRNPKK